MLTVNDSILKEGALIGFHGRNNQSHWMLWHPGEQGSNQAVGVGTLSLFSQQHFILFWAFNSFPSSFNIKKAPILSPTCAHFIITIKIKYIARVCLHKTPLLCFQIKHYITLITVFSNSQPFISSTVWHLASLFVYVPTYFSFRSHHLTKKRVVNKIWFR